MDCKDTNYPKYHQGKYECVDEILKFNESLLYQHKGYFSHVPQSKTPGCQIKEIPCCRPDTMLGFVEAQNRLPLRSMSKQKQTAVLPILIRAGFQMTHFQREGFRSVKN